MFLVAGGTDVDSGTAESAAVFLFGFFFNADEMQSTEESLSELHTYFGPVSQRLFADVRRAVRYIQSCLSDTDTQKISAALDSVTNGNQSVSEEFGRNIKVALDYNSPVNDDDDLDWLESDDDSDVCASGFTMHYSGASQHDTLQIKHREMDTESADSKQPKTNCRAWLYEEVAGYFCAESSEPETCIDDLVSTVFDILCSSKSNDQLQTEVSHSYCGKYAVNVCIEC